MNMTNTPLTTSFRRGMSQVPPNKRRELLADLKSALQIKDRHHFYDYRDGKVQMTVPKMFAVWQTFGRYGIIDPWGTE